MEHNKPRVFIGSSKEAIEYVDAVHEQLSEHAEVTPWSAGVFKTMDYPAESLEEQLENNDFAVFIFSPDDLATIRDKTFFVTRDNTLFELGLFWGKLGRNRVFCMIPNEVPDEYKGEPVVGYRIPTDLSGLTILKYEIRSDKNLNAAVNVACRQIIKRIEELGQFQQLEKKIQQLCDKLEGDYAILRFLRGMAKGLLKDASKKYDYLSEGLWSSFITPEAYTVEGIGIFKAIYPDGLRHVAGNEGRNKFYPFTINKGRKEEERIIVVDCFLKNEEQVLLKDQYIDHKYVFCYPIPKQMVITIAITGRKKLSGKDIDCIFIKNHDLIKSVHYLFGGIVDGEPFGDHQKPKN